MRVRTRRGGTHEEKYPCGAAARGSRAGWVMVMAVRRMDGMVGQETETDVWGW